MSVPAGYERLLLGHAIAVVRSDLATNVRTALINSDGAKTTLLEYAQRQQSARVLEGRAPVFAVALPNSTLRVVVRHNWHGGAFAPITRDLFVAPTRAPQELSLSLALRERGVPTPEIVAYAVYPPGGLLQRADVCSIEIAGGRDLAEVVIGVTGDARFAALEAAAELVATLSRAGARHHDLNAKNLLVGADGAYLLDVDRVTLGESPKSALARNLARLVRSLRKWRELHGAPITEPEIARLESEARHRL